MKTRIIHTKFWKDDYIVSLTSEEKMMFIYFITNEYVNILHLYYLPDRVILFDTGIDRGMLDLIKQKFQNDKKIYFKDGWVFLRNAHRYESYEGEKNNACKEKILKECGKKIRDWYRGIYTQ